MREHFKISNPYYSDVRDGLPGEVVKYTTNLLEVSTMIDNQIKVVEGDRANALQTQLSVNEAIIQELERFKYSTARITISKPSVTASAKDVYVPACVITITNRLGTQNASVRMLTVVVKYPEETSNDTKSINVSSKSGSSKKQ